MHGAPSSLSTINSHDGLITPVIPARCLVGYSAMDLSRAANSSVAAPMRILVWKPMHLPCAF